METDKVIPQLASRPLTLYFLELNKSIRNSKLPRVRDLVPKDMAEVRDKDKSMTIARTVALLREVTGAASRAGGRAYGAMPDRGLLYTLHRIEY